ncbi:amidase [Castellaniella sp. GW247-6E4]|uniref:amidase n=1 Tax=Castellaniella sp. GW247-6E4 TaxID=3140380 RepID=UPI00331574E3
MPIDDITLDGDGLCRIDATALAAAIRERRIRSRDLVDACLTRIEHRDERLQAFITVCDEQARAQADAADRALARGDTLGPLHGIPVAVKDNTATAGIRTTYGSRIRADHVPEADDLAVARLKQAGAIILGKTNTPEFACGAVCTNALRGPTANPWNLDYSSGGSSGGSAAAVADGMVPLAQGTDLGGSVRTPASFCGIVGLRPTPGRIPGVPKALPWNGLSTHGLLTRTVRDAALMFDALSGPDPRDPLSAGGPADGEAPVRGLRIAYCADMGFATIHSEVRRVFDDAIERMRALGLALSAGAPDTSDAQRAFETVRAANLHFSFADLCREHRALCTPSFAWNVERGASISAHELLRAEAARGRVYQSFVRFFEDHDVLAAVSASVPPFLNSQEDVLEIEGTPMANIIDYLRVTYLISLVGFPSISIPCGFTRDGLPIGLQLIARPRHEGMLLALAAELEQHGFAYQVPATSAGL